MRDFELPGRSEAFGTRGHGGDVASARRRSPRSTCCAAAATRSTPRSRRSHCSAWSSRRRPASAAIASRFSCAAGKAMSSRSTARAGRRQRRHDRPLWRAASPRFRIGERPCRHRARRSRIVGAARRPIMAPWRWQNCCSPPSRRPNTAIRSPNAWPAIGRNRSESCARNAAAAEIFLPNGAAAAARRRFTGSRRSRRRCAASPRRARRVLSRLDRTRHGRDAAQRRRPAYARRLLRAMRPNTSRRSAPAIAAIDVWECPPNGQGLVPLVMLKALEGFDASRWPRYVGRAIACPDGDRTAGLCRPRLLHLRSALVLDSSRAIAVGTSMPRKFAGAYLSNGRAERVRADS